MGPPDQALHLLAAANSVSNASAAEPDAAADRGPGCVSELFSSAKAAAAELDRYVDDLLRPDLFMCLLPLLQWVGVGFTFVAAGLA